MKRNSQTGAFTFSGSTDGKPSNETLHCGFTMKLHTSVRAASAGSEISRPSALREARVPLGAVLAGAEPDQRVAVAHVHARGLSTDSPLTSGIASDIAARCGAMRVT